MARGRGRRNNRGGHQIDTPAVRNPAPQAAAHRRGGTHRVKDEDRTNTVFDEWDYKQLKTECIERGVYVKDMKKVEMAKALANNNIERKRAERAAIVERENMQRRQAKEKQRENDMRLKVEAAKHRRRIEKQARRDRDEDVSDDTPDEEELKKMHLELLGLDGDGVDQGAVGQALSEESWDSTSSESTVHSRTPSIGPACKLRLFEWPYATMPPSTAPPSPSSSARSPDVYIPPKRYPCTVPYIPLKIHTTKTKEKLFLPGQTYPPGVDADYVPVLPQQTRSAARNGILSGVLRKATIEPASTWASRTLIQGWNARMFFSLPPRNEVKNLPDVYNKWYLENRRLLRVKPAGDGERVSRDKRHAQRHRIKAKKLAEVLEASEHRVTAMCYLPAYLDFDADSAVMEGRQRKEERTLENLFFVRFPGCDVPHYYFWIRRGEWADPTTRNSEWDPDVVREGNWADDSDNQAMDMSDCDYRQFAGKRLPGAAQAVYRTLTRVKKPAVPHASSMSLGPLIDTVRRIEHELYAHGLQATLSSYRSKWLADGKQDAWRVVGRELSSLFPSGQLPSVPPVRAEGSLSIALKLASIEVSGETVLEPLCGYESWTSDDNRFWDVVETDENGNTVPSTQDIEPLNSSHVEALHRRASISLPGRLECAAWLEQISPSYQPLTPGTLQPDSPLQDVEERARQEWEDMFLQPGQKGMNVMCPFCLIDLEGRTFQQQAEHMHSHSQTTSVQRPTPFDLARSTLPRKPSHVVIPRRKPRTLVTSFFDPGTEADTEKTPTQRSHFNLRNTVTQARADKRRISQLSYELPDTPSSHVPSPYLPRFKRWPNDHANARFDPRKQSTSSAESLEFLDKFSNESVKVPAVLLRVDAARRGSQEVFWALERRASDPDYVPPVEKTRKSRKRRRVVDPTYRDVQDMELANDMSNLSVKAKKRKCDADASYRLKSDAVSDTDDEVRVQTRNSKRRKVVDPTYRDIPSPHPAPEKKKRKRNDDTSYRQNLDAVDSSDDKFGPQALKRKRRRITSTKLPVVVGGSDVKVMEILEGVETGDETNGLVCKGDKEQIVGKGNEEEKESGSVYGGNCRVM